MKTTIDLPDDLLIKAKAVAAHRRTTLKAMLEHALRREINLPQTLRDEPDAHYEQNDLGFLVLKKMPTPLTQERVRKLQQLVDNEDLKRAVKGGS